MGCAATKPRVEESATDKPTPAALPQKIAEGKNSTRGADPDLDIAEAKDTFAIVEVVRTTPTWDSGDNYRIGTAGHQTPTAGGPITPAKSVRATTSSVASTVLAGGRTSFSAPTTPASPNGLEEFKGSGQASRLQDMGGQEVSGDSLDRHQEMGASASSSSPQLAEKTTSQKEEVQDSGWGANAADSKDQYLPTTSNPSTSGRVSGLRPQIRKPSVRPIQEGVQDIDDTLPSTGPSEHTVARGSVLGGSTASFAGQWLPQSPGSAKLSRGLNTEQLYGAKRVSGVLSQTRRASLLKQDMFKRSAYLSSGSVDSRPTYQRDAVDDEFIGGASSASESANIVNWKGTSPRKASLQGVAHGSMVMPQLKGGKRSPKRNKPLPIHAPDNHTTAPVSLGMAAWADLEASNAQWSGEIADGGPVHKSGGTSASMGSIAAWQAIAADVIAEGTEGSRNADATPADFDEALTSAEAESSEIDPDEQHRAEVLAKMAHAAAPVPDIKSRAQGLFYVKYEVQGKLGEGAFGEARLARRRKDGQIFVVKLMHGTNLTEKAKEEARNEVRVLASLNHPNIVKYYETFVDGSSGRLQIVMEFCEEGDLDSYLKKQEGQYLDEEEVLLKFVQICLGLQHVHSKVRNFIKAILTEIKNDHAVKIKGIIHRDLKGNNIFCTGGGILKLGDFGISKVLTPEARAARTMIGTPYYMSPEILKGRSYDGKTDIWAIGCILYELCSLKKAFDASNVGAITVKVMSGKYPPIPAHYSDAMKTLVDALIRREPSERPTLEEVLQLEIVRKGLALYQAYIQRSKLKRQKSYERSVLNLGTLGAEGSRDHYHSRGHDHEEGDAERMEVHEDAQALRKVQEQEALELKRRIEAARNAELGLLRAQEDKSARTNLALFRQGKERMAFVLEAVATEVVPPIAPARSVPELKSGSTRGSQPRLKRSRFSPSQTATLEPSDQDGDAPQTSIKHRPPHSVLRRTGSSNGTAQSLSSAFSAGKREESDDVNFLLDGEFPERAANPGATGLLSQIENLLQMPTIERIPQPPGVAEELVKSARRRRIDIDSPGQQIAAL